MPRPRRDYEQEKDAAWAAVQKHLDGADPLPVDPEDLMQDPGAPVGGHRQVNPTPDLSAPTTPPAGPVEIKNG